MSLSPFMLAPKVAPIPRPVAPAPRPSFTFIVPQGINMEWLELGLGIASVALIGTLLALQVPKLIKRYGA